MNQAHCCWLRSNMVAVNFPPNFSTKRQILKYARKTKMHYIIFFHFFIISSAVWLLTSIKIFTVGKILELSSDHHIGWPLCKLWEHCFSVPDLVFPPPLPPWYRHTNPLFQYINSELHSQCIQPKRVLFFLMTPSFIFIMKLFSKQLLDVLRVTLVYTCSKVTSPSLRGPRK